MATQQNTTICHKCAVTIVILQTSALVYIFYHHFIGLHLFIQHLLRLRCSTEPHSLTPEQSTGRTGRNLEWDPPVMGEGGGEERFGSSNTI